MSSSQPPNPSPTAPQAQRQPFTIRLSAEEHHLVHRAARESAMSMSGWVRSVVVKAARRVATVVGEGGDTLGEEHLP